MTSYIRNLLTTLLLLTLLRLPSTKASVDCGGKPFHCENATHFKICVDFGMGVSLTMDDFVIPCPPGTECRGDNHFECEILPPPTTPAAIASPSDVTTEATVTEAATTINPLLWELVTTNMPLDSRQEKEISERYLNTVIPLIEEDATGVPTDSALSDNDTEVVITTIRTATETVSETTTEKGVLENVTEQMMDVTTVPESVVTGQEIITNENTVTIDPFVEEIINETGASTYTTHSIEMVTSEAVKAIDIEPITVPVTESTNKSFIQEGSVHEYIDVTMETSTVAGEVLNESAVNNGQEININVNATNTSNTEENSNKTLENKEAITKYSEADDVVIVTEQLDASVVDNVPDIVVATVKDGLITNEVNSNIITDDKAVETTTAYDILNTISTVDIGQVIISNEPKKEENVNINNEVTSEITTIEQTIINVTPMFDDKQKVVTEYSTIAETEMSPTVFITDKIDSVTTTTEPELMSSSKTENNGNDITTDNPLSITKTEVTTLGESIEKTINEAPTVPVPVEHNSTIGSEDTLISPNEITSTKKNHTTTEDQINMDTTTETQMTLFDVTTEFLDDFTTTKDLSTFTKLTDKVTFINDGIIPLTNPITENKNEETTVSAQSPTETIFEGNGYPSESVDTNDGWIVVTDFETTTENEFLKFQSMVNTVLSKGDINTESLLAENKNNIPTATFKNEEATTTNSNIDFDIHKLNSFKDLLKHIKENDIEATTTKPTSTFWEPLDGSLMNMPNVLFELDKNTDSFPSDIVTDVNTGIDERPYVGQGQMKTTGHYDTFPILSETIPPTVILSIPSSENTIEHSPSFVVITENITKALNNEKLKESLSNTEQNTSLIPLETTTESVAVPVIVKDEDYSLSTKDYSVTNPHISDIHINYKESEQTTATVPITGTEEILNTQTTDAMTTETKTSDLTVLPKQSNLHASNQGVILNAKNIKSELHLKTDLVTKQNQSQNTESNPDKQTSVGEKIKISDKSTLSVVDTLPSDNTDISLTSLPTYNTQETNKKKFTNSWIETNVGINENFIVTEEPNNVFKENDSTKPLLVESITSVSLSTDTTNKPRILLTDKVEVGGDIVQPTNSSTAESIKIEKVTQSNDKLPTAVVATSVTDYILKNLFSNLDETNATTVLIKPQVNTIKPVTTNNTESNSGQAASSQVLSNRTASTIDVDQNKEVIGALTKEANIGVETAERKTPIGILGITEAKNVANTIVLPNNKTDTTVAVNKNTKNSITLSNVHVKTTVTSPVNNATTTNGPVVGNLGKSNGTSSNLSSITTPTSTAENTHDTASATTYKSSTDYIKIYVTAKPVKDATEKSEAKTTRSPMLSVGESRFDCSTVVRGRYPDKEDCTKFHICLDNHVIVGRCPGSTVFSPILKQCTRNLSHCVKGNEFQCRSQGRFIDILRENIYYICLRNTNGFVRFKFQCHRGFNLNTTNIKCEKIEVDPSSSVTPNENGKKSNLGIKMESDKNLPKQIIRGNQSNESDDRKSKSKKDDEANKEVDKNKKAAKRKAQKNQESNKSDASEESDQSSETPQHNAKRSKSNERKKVKVKCVEEGKIPSPDNCRKYYICYRNKKSELRRKRKKCDSDEVFDRTKGKCVDSESYECDLSES